MKKELISFAKKYPIWTAGLLYFLITLVFTYPLVLNINSEIPEGGGDVYQVISSIDSLVSQIKILDFPHKVLFLAKHINTFTPYVVFNLIFDKIAAYNILFLLTYVLSGLGAFLLAHYLTKNALASFLAGLIFAFSPFHYYQSVAVHLGTMQQQWLPFLVLCLFLFFEKIEFKYFFGSISFAFMIAMAEHQLLAFTAIFAAVFVLYKIAGNKELLKNKKLWLYAFGSALLLAIAAFTMFGQLLNVATSDNNFLDAGMNAANKYSIKILDPIMPPIAQPIWGSLSEKIQMFVWGDSNRGSYFISFSVLAVLIYFGYLLKKKKVSEINDKAYKCSVIFWGSSTLLFYIFSLGVSLSIGKFNIYLPYYLIYKFVPFYENIRTTGRFFIWAMLGVAVLTAYAFVQIIKKYPTKKFLFTLGLSFLILAEFWVAPIQIMPVSYSGFYDTLAKDNEKYNLIEIPGSTDYEFASYDMFLVTVHKKTVLNGMPLARKISKQFSFQQSTPVIKQLLYTMPKGNDPDKSSKVDIIDPFDYALSNELLTYYNVKYVTLNKNYTKPDVLKLEEKFIEDHIAYANRYEDDFLIAYEIKKAELESYYAILGDNDQFSLLFKDTDGNSYRELGDGGQLKIVNMSPKNRNVRILVNAKNSNGPLQLSISSNKNVVMKNSLENNLKEYAFDVTLAPGDNIYDFSVTDLQGKSVSVSTSKKKHQGALIGNISISAE